MRINECVFCHDKLKIKKLECRKCGVSVEGDFFTSPILSLPEDQQTFIELFVLSSGSLKEMAEMLGVTYPTVRAKLDTIIKSMKEEIAQRDDYKNEILDRVAEGKLSPEQAAQILKNL